MFDGYAHQVEVMPQHAFADKMVAELAAAAPAPQEETEFAPIDEHNPFAKGKGKGKGKGKSKAHPSGWLEKCAALAHAALHPCRTHALNLSGQPFSTKILVSSFSIF